MTESPTAVVTGANTGIGKEIARQLVDLGWTVYVGSRDAQRGNDAVTELGGGARPLVLDVTSAASSDAAVGVVAGSFDVLDVLVNNAGVMVDGAPTPEASVESFRRTYETNVFGVLAVTNAFLPLLRRSAHPRIVNISSGTSSLTWSTQPNPQFTPGTGGGGAYRTSKAALNALTLFYAQALAADGVLVNALAPGLRRTGLNARAATAAGDPAEAAAGAVRLALLPDGGPSGAFHSWDGTPVPW